MYCPSQLVLVLGYDAVSTWKAVLFVIWDNYFHQLNHARIQKVLSVGVLGVQHNQYNIFFWWLERIQIPLKAGHHRPASETPFECWLVSFVTFLGIQTRSEPVLLKNPISLWFFTGWVWTPCPLSGSTHVNIRTQKEIWLSAFASVDIVRRSL